MEYGELTDVALEELPGVGGSLLTPPGREVGRLLVGDGSVNV